MITTEDTNVMILFLSISKRMSTNLYQWCGTQNRTRYVDISKLASSLGEDVCQGLIGLHAFTGCHTVSSFAGREKLTALKHLKESETHHEAFSHLEEGWDVSSDLFANMQTFVCCLYASTANTCEVNELRYQLFCEKREEVDSS